MALSTEIIVADGHEKLVLAGAEIVVKNGPDKGKRLTLTAGPQRIGSSAKCDLVLSDRAVSAFHAEIFSTSTNYVMRDLGSKNRLRLGKWQVERVVLANRMKVQIGYTTLEVRSTDDNQEISLSASGWLGELVVHSVAMRAIATQVQTYADNDLPVLIEGETGTGKEVAARTIHQLSARRSRPFVVVDLPGIPKTLIAAELFGYERGAFTGALEARPGLFEEAEGGTIFLDEVGELPLEVQPVLLRAVERRTSRRVGGAADIAHDVRFISATNRNLTEEVSASRFRSDLFYRLTVGRLRMPPLRMRKEDIPVLARQFAEESGGMISPEVVQVLMGYEWPGNVRELRNAIERMSTMSGEALFELAVPSTISPRPEILPLHEARRRAVMEFEKQYLDRLLKMVDGKLKDAAEIAKVSRSFLSRLLNKHRSIEE